MLKQRVHNHVYLSASAHMVKQMVRLLLSENTFLTDVFVSTSTSCTINHRYLWLLWDTQLYWQLSSDSHANVVSVYNSIHFSRQHSLSVKSNPLRDGNCVASIFCETFICLSLRLSPLRIGILHWTYLHLHRYLHLLF